MADVFQTSVSGMLAFQRALATTSHNISNANTAGYSRQITDFSTLTPQLAGGGWIGSGVGIEQIRRLSDENRVASVRTNTSDFKRLETFATLNGRIDNLLADSKAGLAPSLQGFFAAVQRSAQDPSDPTAREVLLTEANNLASRFHYLDSRLQELEDESNGRIQASVNEINQVAESIGRLNREIVIATGRAGAPPNDLLDQRDLLLEQLSERIGTRVVHGGDGQVSVFIGNGQGLVIGSTVNTLGVVPNQFDRRRNEVAFVTNGASVNITETLSGGSLGGALDFRRESLDVVRNQLGQIATSVAVQFNEQHKLGVAFDNGAVRPGGDFFGLRDPLVLANRSGATAPAVRIDPATVGQLSGSDYRLEYDGSDWRVTRLSDNQTTLLSHDGTAWTVTPPGGPAQTLGVGESPVIDGVAIVPDTGPGVQAGDAFMIRPTMRAAGDLGVLLTRADQVAAASPIVGGESVDDTGQSRNTGTGKLVGLSLSSAPNPPLTAAQTPLTLVYNEALGQFDVTFGLLPGTPVGSVAYTPGVGLAGPIPGYEHIDFEITGTPNNLDSFTIELNTNGRGDNGNLLALAGLAGELTMQGGDATYTEFYSALVGKVGSQTQRANVNRDAQGVLLDQSVGARDEVSGVNLEEEAANMLRFQQAFQASAQMVTVANSVFQSLLQAVGR